MPTDNFPNIRHRQLIYIILAVVLGAILFPDTLSRYNLMIDPQIHWVFNSLWIDNFAATQKIIFPHGPLSFLEFPLAIGNNLLSANVFRLVLLIIFFYSLASFCRLALDKKSFITLIAMFLFGQFLDFESLLAANVLLLVLLFDRYNKLYYLLSAMGLALISIYIKISIGIISTTFLFSYFIYILAQHRTLKTSLLYLSFFPFLIFLVWLILYQTPTGFVDYWIGLKELTLGNSESASLYPDNNWFALSLSIICILAVPFLKLEKKTNLIYWLCILSFLAIWKHSMSRQDAWHIMKFFYWVGFVSFLMISAESKYWKKISIISILCLAAYYINVRQVIPYPLLQLQKPSFHNFHEAFFSSDKKENAIKRMEKEFAKCTLEANDLQLIGNASVDCYPYNYCFVASNDLSWQPRSVIQSYAAYTPYLDKKNADHFASELSPEYIIWEMDILQRDRWKLSMTSIDGRYLLHDEPQTIATILSRYKIISKKDNYIILKKRENAITIVSNKFIVEEFQWNTWQEIPPYKDYLSLHLDIKKSILGKLKSTLYKSDALYLLLESEEGEFIKFRFSSANAKEGLWVSPLLNSLNKDGEAISIKAFSIVCNNPSLFSNTISADWSSSEFLDQDELLELNTITAIKSTKSFTNIISKKKLAEEAVNKGKFSTPMEIDLIPYQQDSIIEPLEIRIQADARMSCLSKALVVIEVLEGKERVYWESYALDKFVNQCNQWEPTLGINYIERNKGNLLKVYIWNTGKETISIKNLSVNLIQRNTTKD